MDNERRGRGRRKMQEEEEAGVGGREVGEGCGRGWLGLFWWGREALIQW